MNGTVQDADTLHASSIKLVDATNGKRRWNTQLNPGDMWTNAMRAYDPKTGEYQQTTQLSQGEGAFAYSASGGELTFSFSYPH